MLFRIAYRMTVLLLSICFASCVKSLLTASLLTGSNVGFGMIYYKRGRLASKLSEYALWGAFATGSFAIVRSSPRMAFASAGLVASSVLVPWLIVDRSRLDV